MKLKSIIEKSAQILQQPLPGKKAQQLMAPSFRGDELPLPKEVKESSVLLLLYEEFGEVRITLTKRSDKINYHRGQISFPGGKVDASDASLLAAALRENKEELGIPENQVEILGSLTDLYIPITNFRVYPFVGYVSEKPVFIANPHEVAEVISFPVQTLLEAKTRKEKEWKHKGVTYLKPYFDYEGHIIWGATAMILSEFAQCLRRIETAYS